MNKSLNAVLAGVAVATVGTTIAASPAQAFLNGGIVVNGAAMFNGSENFPATDTIEFNDEFLSVATGDFSTRYDTNMLGEVEVTPMEIAFVGMSGADEALYSYNGLMPFLDFNDGLSFNLDASTPTNLMDRIVLGGGTIFNIGEINGVFVDAADNIVGMGSLTANGNITQGFTIEINTVPEPLTILGTGLALGFGTLFKKSQGAKKEQEVAKN